MSDKSSLKKTSSTPKRVQKIPEHINALKDRKFGQSDVLKDDAHHKQGKDGQSSSQKNTNLEFKKNSPIKANAIATSQLRKSGNVSKKSNANEESAAVACPLTCPADGNKNADSRENETECIESSVKVSKISDEQTKDTTETTNDKTERIAYKTPGPVPLVLTTEEKWQRVENALLAQLTEEDYKLMPKYIPEYESIYDGPWKLGVTPPYMDSSIPKGPTPPSPIQSIQTQPIQQREEFYTGKENYALWNVNRAGVPFASSLEDDTAKTWILKNE